MMKILPALLYMASWLRQGGGIAAKSTGHTLTGDEVTTIKTALKGFFNFTGSGAYGTSCNAKLVTCRAGDNIGALVRLVFHDAAGEGGPNGCLDFVNTHDHRGLETAVSQLDTFYRQNSLSGTISVTDLWILAGAVAIEYASNSSGSAGSVLETLPATPGGLVLPFRYGRYDSSSCNDSGLLPTADYDWAKMKELFVERFGMSVAETVAIMGAHSLGRAEWKNSGFEGGWVTTQSSFSNQYYIEMGTVKWNNSNSSAVWLESLPGKSPETIMLRVDVELLYKTKENSPKYCSTFSSYTSKDKTRCPQQTESFPHFMSYANSITHFFANFSSAWDKMVSLNTSGLALPGTPTNGTYPLASGDTTSPSFSPSLAPPSALPSHTAAPTSRAPTFRPTRSPSFKPSKSPTNCPSLKPSPSTPSPPTRAPSSVPSLSTVPTAAPSQKSSQPTSQPSKSSGGSAASSSGGPPISTIAIYSVAGLSVLIAGVILIIYFVFYRKRARSPQAYSSSVVDIDEIVGRPNSKFEMSTLDKAAALSLTSYYDEQNKSAAVAPPSDTRRVTSISPRVLNPIRRSRGSIYKKVDDSDEVTL